MPIYIPTDYGRPIKREFAKLSTNTGKYFGVAPPMHRSDRHAEIWGVGEASAYLLGVENPKALIGTWTAIPPGADPLERIRKRVENYPTEGWSVEPLNIPPGQYFPRMARPFLHHLHEFPGPFYPKGGLAHEQASATIQLAALADRLRSCFQVVDPVSNNFNVHGSEFRNILLLAATEVEAQWKGVLRANHYTLQSKRPWKTIDYVKLEPALRLADYAIQFPEYPWIEPLSPFKGWCSNEPSGSLTWYTAYNAVKHDREQNASEATLIRALEAVAAVVIMGVAQFGINFVRTGTRWRDLFQLHEHPRWSVGDSQHAIFAPELPNSGEPIDYPFP